jgi:hypothetical protein
MRLIKKISGGIFMASLTTMVAGTLLAIFGILFGYLDGNAIVPTWVLRSSGVILLTVVVSGLSFIALDLLEKH